MSDDARRAEAIASYAALIRYELRLRPGADALAALEARLAPGEPAQRPSPKAPAVRRLTQAARRLRRGLAPQASLEVLAEDLRFLRMFDNDAPALDARALGRLLGDVLGSSRGTRRRGGGAGRKAQARAPVLHVKRARRPAAAALRAKAGPQPGAAAPRAKTRPQPGAAAPRAKRARITPLKRRAKRG